MTCTSNILLCCDAFAIKQMLIENMVGYLWVYHIFGETNKPKMGDNVNDKENNS